MTQKLSDAVERIYALLPALYRIHDHAEGKKIDSAAEAGPIKELIAILAREYLVIEDSIDQLYDDMFIETCAEWVVPYIGDLLGVRGLHSVSPSTNSQRAYVANTIAYRRRKGTAAMLEQLANDVTGWNANVVEYFERLAGTQYLNHLRPEHARTMNLRQWEPMERIGTPFDQTARIVNVRRISNAAGKHNIPNIGFFLWRLAAYRLSESPAVAVGADGRRWMFSPLGENRQLFTLPQTEENIAHLAEPVNVPAPISRRVLDRYLPDYYGVKSSSSLCVFENGKAIGPTESEPELRDFVAVCNLSDSASGWNNMPTGRQIAIDPVLGRVAFPTDNPARTVAVTYQYTFSMDMGGGQYTRQREAIEDPQATTKLSSDLGAALNAIGGRNIVLEITDNKRISGALTVTAGAAGNGGETRQRIILIAADGVRPILDLLGGELLINVDSGAQVTLDGLLITNGLLRIRGNIGNVKISHCTLVPGRSLNTDGDPTAADQPSIIVELLDPSRQNDLEIEIDHTIAGAIRLPPDDVALTVRDSIIDSSVAPAVATVDLMPAGDAIFERVTVVGAVMVRTLKLASDCIFIGPVTTERLQDGCVRHSYIASGSKTPRRFNCQPTDTTLDARPLFVSTRYGDPAYMQLSRLTSIEIRTGASDNAEIGAFHDVFAPQRETNLRGRLDEYLRFGLEAGIFYAT
jgi:hypothetical protein